MESTRSPTTTYDDERGTTEPRTQSRLLLSKKEPMEPTGKSFRTTLPNLDEAQLEKLRRWTEASCAAGLAFREGSRVVLIATRERARTKEASMRSVRGTLGRLGIAPNARKGRWLVLTTEAAVAQEMIERNGCAGQSVEAPPANDIAAAHEAAEAMDDENDRLIELPSARGSSSIRVTKA